MRLAEHEAVVVLAKRTPIGKMGVVLSEVAVEDLAATVLRNLLEKTTVDPAHVDNVVLGNVVGPGGNVVSLLQAGLPVHVPG